MCDRASNVTALEVATLEISATPLKRVGVVSPTIWLAQATVSGWIGN